SAKKLCVIVAPRCSNVRYGECSGRRPVHARCRRYRKSRLRPQRGGQVTGCCWWGRLPRRKRIFASERISSVAGERTQIICRVGGCRNRRDRKCIQVLRKTDIPGIAEYRAEAAEVCVKTGRSPPRNAVARVLTLAGPRLRSGYP